MNNSKTLIKNIEITRFRALQGVKIELGSDVTVICGKNGTAKSSILGIAAQIFSFDKEYNSDEKLPYKTITGDNFKSQFSEHFRISPNHDKPGTMDVKVELHDAYSAKPATGNLTFTTRLGRTPRAVVRNNSAVQAGENTDRNFTHPVIFLSLRRLYPIAARSTYKEEQFSYLSDAKSKRFLSLTNELLTKTTSLVTGTGGTQKSAVSHGSDYDVHSVSTGEDNAGQIILALMSFEKLKEEYKNYKGGLLLIDEADAGLFPAAQKNLIDILNRECKSLNLQVIMTSHSPSLIEKVYEESCKSINRSRFKTVYLTDASGKVSAHMDWDWLRIYADINIRTVAAGNTRLPKVNIYFEDNEGLELFNAVMARHPAKKIINTYANVSLGCTNYIQLIKHAKVPEFRDKSIVCLDSDAKDKSEGLPSIVILPGSLPPDQLIFEYLYNLDPGAAIWDNLIRFSKPNFLQSAKNIRRELNINGDTVVLANAIAAASTQTKIRRLFKDFYGDEEFQKFLHLRGRSANPWSNWIQSNRQICSAFREAFVSRLKHTLIKEFGVDRGVLNFLDKPLI